ncbi:MAG: hypothetical protein ACOX0A_10020 [Thermoguttaceae bacterium]|jgi:hypothetical protein
MMKDNRHNDDLADDINHSGEEDYQAGASSNLEPGDVEYIEYNAEEFEGFIVENDGEYYSEGGGDDQTFHFDGYGSEANLEEDDFDDDFDIDFPKISDVEFDELFESDDELGGKESGDASKDSSEAQETSIDEEFDQLNADENVYEDDLEDED